LIYAIASNIPTFTTQAIAPQQTNNIKQRSPLISSQSDRLKHPYFHNTSDRPSTNQQHQTAIAPNLIKQRSPKISTLSAHKRSPSTNQQHQTAIAPNLNQKAIASNPYFH